MSTRCLLKLFCLKSGSKGVLAPRIKKPWERHVEEPKVISVSSAIGLFYASESNEKFKHGKGRGLVRMGSPRPLDRRFPVLMVPGHVRKLVQANKRLEPSISVSSTSLKAMIAFGRPRSALTNFKES